MRFKEHYFKEIYSQWVYKPDDVYHAIYDFYALNLINPSDLEVKDENLAFSFNEAKKDNIEYIRNFLIEQLERAVSTELAHYLQFRKPEARDPNQNYYPKTMTDEHNKKFYKDYINEFADPNKLDYKGKLIIRTNELSHQHNYSENYKLTKAFMNKHGYDSKDLFNFSKFAFSDISGWTSDQFGGSAWKKIAEAGLQVLDSVNEKDMNKVMATLDHVFDLEHNTGSVFTKNPNLRTFDIKGILDDKRDIKNEMAFYNKVSSNLKGPYAAAIRYTTGKTVESEQPKIDLEDMMNDVTKDPAKIRFFKNPPREVQRKAIDLEPDTINLIHNPEVDMIKYAVEKEPDIFKTLKQDLKNKLPKEFIEDLFGIGWETPETEPAIKGI